MTTPPPAQEKGRDFVRPCDKLRELDRQESGVFTWKFWALVAVLVALFVIAWSVSR